MPSLQLTPNLYSPSIFIGRKQEIEDFWNTLENSKRRILHIQAQGGMGKTKLLIELIDQLEHHLPRGKTAIYPDELIDLYHTSYQIELGILTTIANQFPDSFKSFREQVSRYHHEPSSSVQEELRDCFIGCYSELKANYIILFFDTVEEINEPIKNFFEMVFPRLLEAQPCTLIVTAGRKEFPVKKLDIATKTLLLNGFSLEDITDYFNHEDIKALPDIDLNDFYEDQKLLTNLFELSLGKPILIGLTVDWIRNGNLSRQLLTLDPHEFEENLVRQVGLGSLPENRVILAMAHFHKRFDEKILGALFPEIAPTEKEAIVFIHNMNRYSFVKSHQIKQKVFGIGGTYSCLLHDEMRDLIKKHVWSYLDQGELLLQKRTGLILGYYNELIEHSENLWQGLSEGLERDELRLELNSIKMEKLYYLCFFNFDDAFHYYMVLRKEQRESPWDIRLALLNILDKYSSRMNDEQHCLYRLHCSYVQYDRNNYNEYIEQAEFIRNMPNSKYLSSIEECKAKTIAKSIQAWTNIGKIKEAILFGEQISYFFEKPVLVADTEAIKRQYGHYLSAMGYAFRRQGSKDKPKQFYEMALDVYSSLPESNEKSNFYIASTEINLGFIFHLCGRDRTAEARCKQALRKSNDKNIQWRGYNVLGMIKADSQCVFDATTYFNLALDNAVVAKNKRGIALIRIAQGRMYRQQGWYKVFDRVVFDVSKPEYDSASNCLKEAISLLSDKKDTQHGPDLAEAYTEKGLLLREQAHFQDALVFFERSKELAIRYGNAYLVVDNLQRMAVTYYCMQRVAEAIEAAKEAIEKAAGIDAPHVIARAEKVLADIAYQHNDYDVAFDYAFSAMVNILRTDNNSQDDSMPKKERLYDEFCNRWIINILENIPEYLSVKHRKAMCDKWAQIDYDDIDKEIWAFDLLVHR